MKKTIKEAVLIEHEINKSKFLSYLAPVKTEDEAKEYLREIKRLHPKATHHCSAYVCGDIERSNDDGEPASSAGLPMLQVLRGNDLDFVIAVVVRYYGGVLLGVGGLIRAYGSSVSLALEAATIMVPSTVYTYTLAFPYEFTNEVETHLTSSGVIVDREYDALAKYTVEVLSETILDNLNDFTSGTIVIESQGSRIDYKEEVSL